MVDTTKDLDQFKAVTSDAHNIAMQIADLTVLYAELAMFHTYVKARYPDVCTEAQLFIEETVQNQREAANAS